MRLLRFLRWWVYGSESSKAGECTARLSLYGGPRERVDNKQAVDRD